MPPTHPELSCEVGWEFRIQNSELRIQNFPGLSLAAPDIMSGPNSRFHLTSLSSACHQCSG